MDSEQIISYLFECCKNNNKTEIDKNKVNKIFKTLIISPNYDNGCFVIYSAMCGNLNMLKILKQNGASMDINDNEPLRIAAQNKFNECALFLFNDSVDIENYNYSASYTNLKFIREMYIIKNL